MPQYIYKARDSASKLIEGRVEADSETAAINRLGSQGVYPLMITLADTVPAEPVATAPAGHRVPGRHLAYLSRQLADLLSGGLPLSDALSLLSEQTEHRGLRHIVVELGESVRDGQAFSEALAHHPHVFSPLYVNMIRAGEAGGGLDAVLNRLADLFESEDEFRGRVTSAMVYPSVVLVIGIITVAVLLIYVVPKLTVLFTETGQALPLPTRVLLAVSGVLSRWWWLCAIGLVAAGGAVRAFQRSGAGRVVVDLVVLSLPLAGDLVRKVQTARFTRNLGVMIGQGVAMLQALEVAGSTVSSVPLRRAITRLRDMVQHGESLSNALVMSGQFPRFVSNLVRVGEESGTLETALLKVAVSYERQTDRTLRTLTTILEPLLIVVVGLVVMFIVISMLLPIFQLGLVAQ